MRPQKGNPNAVMLDRADPEKGIISEAIWTEGQGEPSGNVMKDFVTAIREGREPKTNLERALLMQKITDAIYASSEIGEAVPIT